MHGPPDDSQAPRERLLTTRNLALAALFAALTALGAYVAFPVYGAVPFSLQVFAVLLAGLVLGARLGALSMLAYVLLGLVAPVYAGGGSGLGTLFGPAGGYIWGFVAAAFLTGLVAERARPRGVAGLCGAAAAGLLPIYAMGAAWLSVYLHSVSFTVIIWGGVLQFVPVDAAKVVLAALVARALLAAPLQLPAYARR
jgi:biotin transport system substrate-specific component